MRPRLKAMAIITPNPKAKRTFFNEFSALNTNYIDLKIKAGKKAAVITY